MGSIRKFLLLAVFASVCAIPSPARLASLRKFQRPDVLDLTSAKALHADITSRARRIEALHGHHRATIPRGELSSSLPTGNFSVPTIFPTDFGADPTGKTDSTAAMARAVSAWLAGGAKHQMASGIADLGGATLDLAGGQYLINAPIVVPMFVGNMLVARGTLRAGPAFPANKWLVMVGDTSCNPPGGQGSCNEFVNVIDVLFDSSHVAAGRVSPCVWRTCLSF